VVRWAVLSVGLGIVLAAGWWVTNSPVFDLRSLKVEGNVHVTTAQVASLSGLTSTSNVLWLNADAVERRVEADPWVLVTRVSRDLPSGIIVTVEERVPVAVTAGRDPMLVAGDGMVLGPASEAAQLPVIETNGTFSPGERVPESDELAVVRSLPPDLLPMAATVRRDSGGSVALALRDGVEVTYGDATAAAAKSEALRAVLSWAARHGIHPASVDVRAPTAPALSPTG
jgi:cell division protein FtsQ